MVLRCGSGFLNSLNYSRYEGLPPFVLREYPTQFAARSFLRCGAVWWGSGRGRANTFDANLVQLMRLVGRKGSCTPPPPKHRVTLWLWAARKSGRRR